MTTIDTDRYGFVTGASAALLWERADALCDVLGAKAVENHPTSTMTFAVEDHKANTRFVRIVQSGRSVHAFIDRTTGDLVKAAGWKVPAKRKDGLATVGSLLDDETFVRILAGCDPYGGYLYADSKAVKA